MGQFINSVNKYRATFLWASFFPFVWWECYLFRRLFDKMNVWIIHNTVSTKRPYCCFFVIVIIKCYHPTCPIYGWREWSLKNRCDLLLSLCIGYLPLARPVTIFFILCFFQGPTSTHDIDRGPVPGWFPPAGRASRRWEEGGEWGQGISFLSYFPGFCHWLCFSMEDDRHSQGGWLYLTFSVRNPETAPTSRPAWSTDSNELAATSSELLNHYPFMKTVDQTLSVADGYR